jgi:hypothetical protein
MQLQKRPVVRNTDDPWRFRILVSLGADQADQGPAKNVKQAGHGFSADLVWGKLGKAGLPVLRPNVLALFSSGRMSNGCVARAHTNHTNGLPNLD